MDFDDVQGLLERKRLSRRNALRTFGAGTALLSAGAILAGCAGDDDNPGQIGGGGGTTTGTPGGGALTDADVLNFALNLEYLEAEFYSFALTGAGLTAGDTGGTGNAGATTGGKQVALSGNLLQIAQEIAADELAHVRFLRSALGSAAVAKPVINLNALGLGFNNETEFLILSRAFEDVGVSAYTGAAGLLTNKTFLQAAAQIQGTEAYHAGNIRYQLASRGISAPPVDGKDQPPTTANFFPTDSNGLAISRTAAEVGAIVRGTSDSGGAFFPAGLNGAIK